jgi:hypothetical protein
LACDSTSGTIDGMRKLAALGRFPLVVSLVLVAAGCGESKPDPAACDGGACTGDEVADAAPGVDASVDVPFRVYSAGKCFDDLSMASHGILRNTLLSQGNFFSAGYPTSGPTDPARVQEAFEEHREDGFPIVFDIESWDLPDGWTEGTASEVDIAAVTQQYMDVIDVFRADPSLVIGYYGEMPVRNYLSPVHYANDPTNPTRQESYERWQRDNDFFTPIAAAVDILYPSLYTFTNYQDPEDWQTYGEENIGEAYRLSGNQKLVVPYLWPRLHSAGTEMVPGLLWRKELEVVRANADGVVIWIKSDDSCAEIGASDLWQETISFLGGLQ